MFHLRYFCCSSFLICHPYKLLTNACSIFLQDVIGLVISILLLGDFSLVLLTLLQLYSISMLDVFFFLSILPLGILLPFPSGINALFSNGPARSAVPARVYALWNIISTINVVSSQGLYASFLLFSVSLIR